MTEQQTEQLPEMSEQFARQFEELKAYTKGPLLPVLEECLVDVNGTPYVHHPLVVHSAYMPGLINRVYQDKLAELEKTKDARDRIWLYERPYRLLTLYEWFQKGEVDREQMRELLPAVWTDAEGPSGGDDDDLSWLVALFRAIGFYSDIGWEKPQLKLPVYRGGHPQGIAWTLDKGVAAWFSLRFKNNEQPMYQAEVPPEGVLAILMESRRESEVVVDPDYLTNLQEIPRETVKAIKAEWLAKHQRRQELAERNAQRSG